MQLVLAMVQKYKDSQLALANCNKSSVTKTSIKTWFLGQMSVHHGQFHLPMTITRPTAMKGTYCVHCPHIRSIMHVLSDPHRAQ